MLQPFNISSAGWSRRPGESIWADSTPTEWRRHLYDLSKSAHSLVFEHQEFGITGQSMNTPMNQFGFAPQKQTNFPQIDPAMQFEHRMTEQQFMREHMSDQFMRDKPDQFMRENQMSDQFMRENQISDQFMRERQFSDQFVRERRMSELHLMRDHHTEQQLLREREQHFLREREQEKQQQEQIKGHSRDHRFRGQQLSNQFPHSTPRRRAFLGSEEPSKTDVAGIIAEYFGSDPHERVPVTLKYVDSVFKREQQFLSDAHQLPKFPMEKQMHTHNLCIVEFKAGRVDAFHLPKDSRPVFVGDLVIVEADRGKDLGRVAQICLRVETCRMIKLLQIQDQQRALTEDTDDLTLKNFSSGQHVGGSAPMLHFPKPIIGLALQSDILSLVQKKQDEDKACRLCLAKISTVTSGSTTLDLLQMKLVDAEYQFDRKKLIFYYSTRKRIDFRDLVRELFRIYKTRIWMCAVVGLPYAEKKPAVTHPLSSPIMLAQQFSFGNYTINNDIAMLGQVPTPTAYRRMSLDDADPLLSIDEVPQEQFAQPVQKLRHSKTPAFANENFNSAQRLSNTAWQQPQVTGEMDGLMLKSLVDSIDH